MLTGGAEEATPYLSDTDLLRLYVRGTSRI
jgi:hypothetical protein